MQPLPRPRGLRANLAAARALTSDPCPALDALASRLGPSFAVRIAPVELAVIGDPAHLHQLFELPKDALRADHRLNVLRFYVGRGSMVVADGDEHRRRRAAAQPAFTRRRLGGLVPMIVAATDRMIDTQLSATGAPIDLFPLGRRLTLEVILQALAGPALAGQLDTIERLIEPAKAYLEQSVLRQLPHPLPHTRRSRCRTARRQLDRLIETEFDQRTGRGPGEPPDLIDLLMAGAGAEVTEAGPARQEVLDQLVTLIAAGFDTTASALAWTLLRAASTPGLWDRLRLEADAVLGRGTVAPDACASLDLARAVMKESLRLHPPGVFTPRVPTRDLDLGAYRISAGTMILWCPYLSGRDPRVWADPTAFVPERHLSPTPEQASAMRAAWVPFGRGPRTCIGFVLAEMELTLMVARLAQRLDIDVLLTGGEMPRPHGMVINRPAGGVPAIVSV